MFMIVWATLMWALWPWVGPWIKNVKIDRGAFGDVEISSQIAKSDSDSNWPTPRTGE